MVSRDHGPFGMIVISCVLWGSALRRSSSKGNYDAGYWHYHVRGSSVLARLVSPGGDAPLRVCGRGAAQRRPCGHAAARRRRRRGKRHGGEPGRPGGHGRTRFDPARYGVSRHPRTQAPATLRDAWDLAVTSHALRLGVPLLAICRGMQVLNVCRGGTLHQHLPDLVGHGRHDGPPNGFGLHHVQISPDSMLAGILPDDGFLDVPTHHHQAVDLIGDGLKAVAWEEDGTIEAVEAGPSELGGIPASCSACSGTLNRAATLACSPRSSAPPWTGPPPGGTWPGGTQPGEPQPGEPQPGGTWPGGTRPGGTWPGGTRPGGTRPDGPPLAARYLRL